MGFSELHSWTKNPEETDLFWVIGMFWTWTVTTDETWIHHFGLGSERQSMEWHHPCSPREKNWKSLSQRVGSWSLFSGTVKVWFLWMRCLNGRQSTKMHTSGHWLNSGIISNEFILTRIQQKSCLIMILPGCTHVCRLWKPSQYGLTVLPHLTYSFIIASSDFCLLGSLNDEICSVKFETDDVIHMMRTWPHEQDKAWYWQGIHTCSSLVQGCRSEQRLVET